MRFLDGVYVGRLDESARFHRVDSPTSQELARLTQTIARQVGRNLERQGLLERDAENRYLAALPVWSRRGMNIYTGHFKVVHATPRE